MDLEPNNRQLQFVAIRFSPTLSDVQLRRLDAISRVCQTYTACVSPPGTRSERVRSESEPARTGEGAGVRPTRSVACLEKDNFLQACTHKYVVNGVRDWLVILF